MRSLAPEYSTQPMTMGDVPRLNRFVNACARRWAERNVMTEDRLRVMLSLPGLDLATSVRLVLRSDGNLVAAGIVFRREPHVAIHA